MHNQQLHDRIQEFWEKQIEIKKKAIEMEKNKSIEIKGITAEELTGLLMKAGFLLTKAYARNQDREYWEAASRLRDTWVKVIEYNRGKVEPMERTKVVQAPLHWKKSKEFI